MSPPSPEPPPDPGPIFVPYGTQNMTRQAQAADAGGPVPDSLPAAPVMRLDGRGMLRLWDVAHPFAPPPRAADMRHAEDQLAFLQAHVTALCGAWERALTGFVAAYFAAIRAHVGAHDAMLAARAGDLVGLVEPRHWCLGAPMPLPRAHLPAPGGRIRVDIAFHAGGETVACILAGGSLTPGRRADLDRLEASGTRVLLLPPRAVTPTPALLDRLGPAFAGFLDGIDLPQSPFGGRPLAAPAPR